MKSKFLRWLGLVSLLVFLTACPRTDPPTVTEREPIIPTTTKVPDKATRDVLSVYNVETGIMRFTNSTPILDNLKVGDVFVGEPSSNAPNGYLRKVTKITKEGAEVILETTQAKLTDAIHQGTLVAEGEIQPSQLRSVTPLSEGASGRAIYENELSSQAGTSDGFNFEAAIDSFIEIEGKAGPVSGTAKASFKGLVKFDVGYRVLVDIGFLADLNWAEAVMGYTEEVSISVGAEVAGVIKGEKEVARYDFSPIVFFIGPVPVVIVPSAKVVIGLKGEASITFDYKFSQNAKFEQGVRWDEDDGFRKIDINEFNVKHEGPKFKAKGSVSAYTRASMRLLFYYAFGPDFGATVGAKLEVQYPGEPLWRLYGFVEGDLAFTIDLLGEELRYNEKLFKIEKEIARGEATPPTITILKPNATVGLRIASDLSQFFKVEDQIGATATLSSDRDGNIGSVFNNYKFLTPGKRIITITANSQTGKTSQASFNVDVINTPPILAEVSGPTTIGAGVGWALGSSATASNPNEESNRVPCSSLTWSITGGLPLTTETNSNKGCDPFVVFGTEGEQHQITVVATDPEGATSTKSFTVNVTERPDNIPPTVKRIQVTGFDGAFEARSRITRNQALNISAVIHNPDNAPLEYEWAVFGPYNPVGFGFELGTAATATYNGFEDKYNQGNNAPYECSLDNDNNPRTCPARFRLVLKSNGVTIGAKEFDFILDYSSGPPK